MPILLTPTKLATKRFIKLFVDVNKSILDKQKNRKPEPAVKEHFRKFPFYLLKNYFVVINPSGSTVNSGLSAILPSGLR